MRIRKRSGPLGLPSISTILSHSSSDPPLISTRKHEEEEDNTKRLNPSYEDEHQPTSDQVHQTSKTSSDLELTFIRGKNGWVCCSDDGDINRGLLVEEKDEFMMMNTNPTHKIEEMNTHKELKGLEEEAEEEEEEEDEKMIRTSSTTATKNRRSNSLSTGEEEVINFGSGVPPFSSKMSSHDDPHKVLLHERWCEGVKGFPMKKRRGSNCERKVLGDEEIARTTTMEMIKQKKIMKTVTNPNKKWVLLHEKDSQETDSTSSVKKNEGSRCSRINGRGWRCCQQALVGYSLCEHHSCKGRLMRSMTSARNRSTAITTADDVAKKNLETRVSLKKCHEDEEETSTTTMMRIENKKRKKTGMVKARSIRSLLGQTQVHDDYVKV